MRQTLKKFLPVALLVANVQSCMDLSDKLSNNDGPGGGPNHVVAGECVAEQSLGWQTETVKTIYPVWATFAAKCGTTVSGPQSGVATVAVDVDMAVHTGLPGFVGHFDHWQRNLLTGNGHKVDDDLPFSSLGPTYIPNTTRYPERGSDTFSYTIGATPASGLTESDSLAMTFPTHVSYLNLSYAAAYSKVKIIRTNIAGTIIGASPVRTGDYNGFRMRPDWDTTLYRYQWYVNGTPGTSDTAATFARSFPTHGSYTLRADQILADSSVLSSYLSVTAQMNVGITGSSTLNNGDTGYWSVVVGGGHAPYSCTWYIDSSVAQTGSCDLSQAFYDAPATHYISVSVTDNDAATASSTSPDFNVTIHSGSGGGDQLRAPASVPQLRPRKAVPRAAKLGVGLRH